MRDEEKQIQIMIHKLMTKMKKRLRTAQVKLAKNIEMIQNRVNDVQTQLENLKARIQNKRFNRLHQFIRFVKIRKTKTETN